MTLNQINPEALGQRTENDQVLVGHASPSLSHDNKSLIPAQLKELDDISKMTYAAVIMLSADDTDAAKILEYIKPEQIEDLTLAMSMVENMSNSQINKIYSYFI